MSRIGTKLKYKIERDAFDLDKCVIVSGSVRLRAYRRRAKYDGWNGWDAYTEDSSNVYKPAVRASKWFPLLRKIEKLEGVILED